MNLQDVGRESIEEDSIAVRELVPVVVAAANWGSSWQGKFIQFNSDNSAVVEVLNKQYSSKVMLNHLLRCLFFFAAKYSFWFCTQHVQGVNNGWADTLSRGEVECFRFYSPQGIDKDPTRVAQEVNEVILDPKGDWVSELRRLQFRGISRRAYQQRQGEPMRWDRSVM